MRVINGLILLALLGFAGPAFSKPAAPVVAPNLLTGKTESIGYGAKGLVVAFLSAKCPCSRSHVPELKALVTEHPDFNFVAIHSNRDESLELSRPYFASAELPFPVLEDEKAQIADQFKAFKTPHVFVVLKDGTIAFQGGMTDSKDCAKSDKKYLRDALEDLTAGRAVRKPYVRTLGCAIVRRASHVY